MIFYTDKLIPKRFSGYTIGPVILIRPSHRDDYGLLAHEKTHVDQFWASLGLLQIIAMFSKTVRLRMELEAYQHQAMFYPDDRRRLFAEYLATKYNFGITVERAYALLMGYE